MKRGRRRRERGGGRRVEGGKGAELPQSKMIHMERRCSRPHNLFSSFPADDKEFVGCQDPGVPGSNSTSQRLSQWQLVFAYG